MKRKLIQMAGKTMVVSLPAPWIKKWGLKKGDEIDLAERGQNIIIGSQSEVSESKTILDITGIPKAIIKRLLISAYTFGFDEIKLVYKNAQVEDLKSKTKINIENLINSIAENFIGVEIIEQGETYTLLKQVSKISETEFDNVLRRVFFLLNSISQETLEVIKTKDSKIQEIVNQKHDTIEKFSNYCLRLLNKKGHKDYRKTSMFYFLVFELEEIADIYNFTSREVIEKNLKPSKNAIKLFEHVNHSWSNFYKLFYQYNKEMLIDIIKDRRIVWAEINKVHKKASASDLIISGRLSLIIIKILNLTETRMTIELDSF